MNKAGIELRTFSTPSQFQHNRPHAQNSAFYDSDRVEVTAVDSRALMLCKTTSHSGFSAVQIMQYPLSEWGSITL